MYYHLQIKIKDKTGKSKRITDIDRIDRNLIIEDVILPYQKDEQFIVNGTVLEKKDITRLKVLTTDKSARELSNIENYNMPPNVVMYVSPQDILHYDNYITDITEQILDEASQYDIDKPINSSINKNKVLIVQGNHDEVNAAITHFVEKLGFEAVILRHSDDDGKTMIERLEGIPGVGFAIVLYSPCDISYLNTAPDSVKNRACQNIVFEHGYLISKLGVNNVSALIQGDVETPDNVTGVVYIHMALDNAWKIPLAKEMKSSGLDVDYNLVM